MIKPCPVDGASSRRMAAVRHSGTEPELAVRRMLDELGFAYEVDVRGVPGTPDILAGRTLPVFVHGCFWHRHKGCAAASMPKRNSEYWTQKFADNVQRDRRVLRDLRHTGYRPLVVWQCETRMPTKLKTRLKRWLHKNLTR